jgi:hypothetical protein
MGQLEKQYVSALATLLEVDSKRVNITNRTVGLLIFRISVFAISIFTVIFLIRVYRVNTTIGDVFRGRMIALLASDQDIESFALRAAALSAEHVDFGREPKHPIDYMLSTIREFGKVLRPSSRRPSKGKTGNPKVEELKAGHSPGADHLA